MKCKVCQGDSVSDKYRLDPLIVGQCRDCRSKFVTSDIKDSDLIAMYSSEGAVDYLATREERNLVKFERRLREIKRLRGNGVNGLRLLDVGCGVGDFCYAAARDGIRAVGIDISGSAIKLAQERYGDHAEYYNVRIEDMVRRTGEAFDIVTLWDVIEHCRDPLNIISCCRSLMKKGGVICIDTPNCDSLYDKLADVAYRVSRRIGKRMLKQRYSTAHLQLWTELTLKKLLSRCDLEVVASERIRELTMMPSCYVKAMGANERTVRLVQSVDEIAERIWPIRNKVLVYAQVN
ncbi:MAG: class I SAM-dependent methyltransferase [Phycisphaerae bacterium]|nr:class I SAM-dependent methyltransferase [Phycisphaerae bacterium]